VPEIAYLDFDLELERDGASYRVEVNSPAGQSSGLFVLPFADLEIENFLLRIGQSRRVMRRMDSPETEAAKAFGARLFDAVFAGEARACLRSSLDEAGRQGKGLRIRLRLNDTPELAGLPWEYLYNSSLNRFLALSVETPVVRYLELSERIRPLAVQPPLRVLALIASPRDQAPLDIEREWRRLRDALGDLEARGLVTLERLERASLADLQRQLRRGQYHILHFVGHGGFDERTQDGVLLLEDEDGLSYRISGQDLGMLLHDHRSLRLALLNSCDGARASRTDPFAGTAQSLVQQGLPAVIAMQFEISDDAAIELAREFYGAIADGYPVDAALAEARKTILAAGSGVEWGTPVLYLRADDARIFDLAAPTSNRGEATLVPRSEPPRRSADVPAARDQPPDERFLDAALPDQVVVGQAIELVTLIRLPSSAGLRGLLESDPADFEAGPHDVRSRELAVDFPRDSSGRAAPLDLTIAIESTDFQIANPQQRIRLDPYQDTEPIVFLLTPLHGGELRLLVHVFVEQRVLLASGFLKVSGVSQLAEGLRPLRRLISLSLGSFGIGRATQAHPPRPTPSEPINDESLKVTKDAEDAGKPAPPVDPGRLLSPLFGGLLVLVVLLIGSSATYLLMRSGTATGGPTATVAVTSLPPTALPAAQPTVTAPTVEPTVAPAVEPTDVPTPQPTAVLTPGDFARWGLLRQIDVGAIVNGVAFAPDGGLVASASADRRVRLWGVADGKLRAELDAGGSRNNRVTNIAFAPAGDLLAAATSDGTVVLWDTATRQPVRTLPSQGRRLPVQSVAFSHSGELLAAGGDDQTIRIWRVADGTLLRELSGHSASVWALAFAPDDQTLVSGANEARPSRQDSAVRLWDVASGRLVRMFDGHTQGILSVAFSPDGRTLASGSWDTTVRLWDAASGKLLHTLEGHPRGAGGLAFAGDGRVLASAAGDGNARIWDVGSGRLLRALEGHTSWASSVAFAPDGALLASGSADQSIRLWGVQP
jgi:sugar lactone lactonase YvrE